jgi:hypothetical protein
MHTNEIIGSLGVAILLLAYFLSSFKIISQSSKLYIVMNLTGAGIACYASVLINFIPFVVLEGIWALVALAALLRSFSFRAA